MKLNEAIIIESPQGDREQRQRAMKAYNDLIRAFNRIGGLNGMVYGHGAYLARETVLRHPENIALALWPAEAGKDGGMHVANRTMHLYLDLNGDVASQMQTGRYRTTIIHEFIHLFDSERMRDMEPTNNLPNAKYFNNPIETNAYYQEAIAKFEETMARLGSAGINVQLERMKDFNQFMGVIDMMMAKDFNNWRDVKTDQKLNKRLYQYWDEYVRTGLLK